MTTPDELDKLLADILEGEANEEQLTRFDELVLEHPELLQRCQEHLRMQSALVGMGNSQSDNDFVETVTAHAASITAEDEGAFLSTLFQKKRRRSHLKMSIVGLAVAACLTLSLIWLTHLNKPAQSTPAARTIASLVSYGEEGLASAPRSISSAETINLENGRAKIHFASGCVLALDGPATLEIQDAMNVKLVKGRLNAWCPPEAKGFRVATPDADLVDLGTSFGINLGEDHKAEFVVFDGLVQIENDREKTLLRNGQSLLSHSNDPLKEVPFETSSYSRSWLLAEGIVSTTGAVVPVEPNTPEGIANQRDDLHVLVSPENRNVTVERPLKVDLLEPGTFTADRWYPKIHQTLQPSSLTGNLSSYLIHARVERPVESGTDHVHYQGSVTFAEPVVAIVASQNFMKGCDHLFATGAWKQVVIPINNRGLEGNTKVPPDFVTLSDDRLTVTIDLHVGYGIDELRVLTRSTPKIVQH